MGEICAIAECPTRVFSKGWCEKHYRRHHRTGNTRLPSKLSGYDKVCENLLVTPSCWLWVGHTVSTGYAHITVRDKPTTVHKFLYELFIGNVAKGLVVDHKFVSYGCPRACVNPYHMRAIPQKRNMENRAGLNKNNSSGFRGVSWSPSAKAWDTRVRHNKEIVRVGYFPLYELHIAGYKAMLKRNELFTCNSSDRVLS